VLRPWLKAVRLWAFHRNLRQRCLDSKRRRAEYRFYGNYQGETAVSFKQLAINLI